MGKAPEPPSLGRSSMFGKMHLSSRQSAPEYGFGSGDRATRARVHVTEDHAKNANHSFHSPGPIYPPKSSLGKMPLSRNETGYQYTVGRESRFPSYEENKMGFANPTANGKNFSPGAGTYQHTSSVGRQSDSTKPTKPSYVFGNGSRQGETKVFYSKEHAEKDMPRVSPGPVVCNTTSSVGMQPSSVKPTNPSWVLGSESRFKYEHAERASKIPGAGQYEADVALGQQTMSKKKSLPSYSFGTGGREQLRKVFISKDHTKDLSGTNSPGPATVELVGSVGKQVSSKKKSSAAWGFGSAKRFVYNTHKAPGPGAYEPQ
ncbi:hypothetical protein CYMTET_33657 [Cymbomonas tetramitiformis]|uniref:Flagellar associated protein n=1 Tax=Cymbomonas tetramitiformis TaxID=36881 RepID=A0AAE0FCR4_9CHLO|nr:hypothetical protein CYMTET_33657 [Cymbomonas tetramitiformis]